MARSRRFGVAVVLTAGVMLSAGHATVARI
jgi:hypothetical protein